PDGRAPLRVLHLEDDPLDAELVVRELRKSGYDVDWHRVDTAEEFTARLGTVPDLIISDHAMPQFSSVDALRHLKSVGLAIPFIVVSHAIGEEEAVSLMRGGAADYLMKDRLTRLGEAVRHALETQALRQAVEARTRDLVSTHGRLRELASELTLAELRVRRRVATELHDHLAQLLVLCRLKLGQSRRLHDLASVRKAVQQTEETLGETLAYTRTLVADLAPPVLHDLGLPAALNWLGEYMRRYDLSVAVSLDHEKDLALSEDAKVLLFQSVRELLMNVHKYARVGEAIVRMHRQDELLRIEVRDEGTGFDPAEISAERHTGSPKFGLFSIRERMMALGGSFDIDSAPGKGTRVLLMLPLSTSGDVTALAPEVAPLDGRHVTLGPRPFPPAPDAQHSGLASGPIRVLLVDDHAMVRQGLRSLLEGYADVTVVGEAANGEEALAAVALCRPSVVVMDVNMPKMNGIDATARIKAQYPGTAVIGISVQADDEPQRAMLKAGAALLLTKDAAVDQLYSSIRASFHG
ncbi:MAG TPA: response regulator, partial [Nitrospira sp.]|nr:response regulator [Nitrospira sp.]